MDKNWLFDAADVATALPDDPTVMRFHYALRHGTMKLGLYAPRGEDTQGPHRQDELYVIVRGTGSFVRGAERRPFGPGDAVFVEAGCPHRFEDFTADFQAWVIFWGPASGEAGDTAVTRYLGTAIYMFARNLIKIHCSMNGFYYERIGHILYILSCFSQIFCVICKPS